MSGKAAGGTPRRCKATKADGAPCGAAPLRGEEWCLAHHPERRAEHHAQSAKGGRQLWAARIERTASEAESSAAALLQALLEILEELRSDRRVNVPRLRCAIYCVSTMMEAAKLVEFGGQLDELSAVIQELQKGTASGSVELPPTGTAAPWRPTDPA